MPGRMIARNIWSGDGRTGMRFEPELWDAIDEICEREDLDRNELVRRIEENGFVGTRTGAVRVYLVEYFRQAATEAGHRAIGHGRRKS